MTYGYDVPRTETPEVPAIPPRRVRRSGLGTGTTSLLMIFTLLCLSTLALLSLSTAASDARIKGRGLAAAQGLAVAEGEAAVLLAGLDSILLSAQGAEESMYYTAVASLLGDEYAMEGDLVTFVVPAGGDRSLTTVVRLAPPGSAPRYEIIAQTQESTVTWTPGASGEVWQGN